ncbi:MAG: YHS domain-containing protein [Cupriavidus sp.]|nr:YHS domain-containing protein [Cupriavidus sp.]
MSLLTQNLAWVLLSGVALSALVAWQRYMSRRENSNSTELHRAQECTPTADDPVTGNSVRIAHAIAANFEGKTYFFESESSRAVFQQDPERYIHRHHRHHDCC